MFSLATKTGGGQTASANDIYFNYVTLLLHGDGTNGALNNTFLDSSTNNYTVTRSGNTTQGNFVPFNYNYSAYLLGSASQYFTLPTALNTQYGALAATTYGVKTTIEFWVFTTAIQAITAFITGVFGNFSATAVNGRYAIDLVGSSTTSTQTVRFAYTTGPSSQATVTSTATLTQNTWNHVAVTIDTTTSSSSTIIIYVNGVGLTFTGQNLSTHTTDPAIAFVVGYSQQQQTVTGYLSNFRFSRGSSLIYTGDFTPPTQKFQPTTSTKALLFQNPYLIDDSPYEATITPQTAAAAPTMTPFSPYLNYVQPTPTSYSGSFDGTGDFITVLNNTALQMSTGDFTWECWIFINRTSTAMGVMGLGTASTGLEISVTSGNNIRASFTATTLTGATALTPNAWYHVALVRSGSATGNIKIYLNGALEATSATAITTDFNQTNNLVIGDVRATGTPFNGLISNVRITEGIAVYTGTFTVPTAPLADTQSSGTNIAAITLPSYSNYFNGTSAYLQAPVNAVFTYGTADFTIEGWLYQGSTSGQGFFYDGRGSSAGVMPCIFLSSGVLTYFTANASRITGSTIAVGAWYHIALSRISASTRLFVNGVQVGSTYADTNSYALGSVNIGSDWNNSATSWLTGFISNMRVIKNQGLYSGTFTPPTGPYSTTAVGSTGAGAAATITGTVSLLTCQSTTFIDNSSNALTITNRGPTTIAYTNPFAPSISLLSCQQNQFYDGLNINASNTITNGQAQPNQYNPFGFTTSTTLQAYSTTVNGGSMYYDGTTDFLTLPSNQLPFSAGTGDFTFECWVYITSIAGTRTIYDTCNAGDSTGTGRFAVQISTSGVVQAYTLAGSVFTSGGTVRINTWNHIAFSRNNASSRLYLNGTQVNTTYADTNNYVVGTVSRPIIGVNAFDNSSNPFLGNLLDLRLVKGTGLYAASFVPSATPLTAVTNTSLLLLGTNGAIYDNSVRNVMETSTASISTSVVKYGTGSIAFVGTGYMKYPPQPIFGFGTGDFTVEFWMYVTSTPATEYTIWESQTTGAFIVHKRGSSSGLSFAPYGGTERLIQADASIPLNTWQFIAISRVSGTTSAYVNNTRTLSVADTNNYVPAATANPYTMGARNGGTLFMPGYIDDFRVTLGVGRYSGTTITVPTAAFPNQ